ncbi:MAG: hypothetical protein STSR0008_21310 [Ignavibacterium sp.]
MALTFKQKINSIKYFLTHPKAFKMILSFNEIGYLNDEGWFKTFYQNSPIDKNQNPIPWFTYSFIDFLKERIKPDMTAFEYGAGNSTLFFASRVQQIFSIETSKDWYERIKKNLPHNAELFYWDPQIDKNLYTEIINSTNRKYDIIVVDANDRNECMINSYKYLNENGVIILDDSEREEYKEGINFILKEGFKKLDFWGFSPGLFYKKCTSIFYRNNNCFNI